MPKSISNEHIAKAGHFRYRILFNELKIEFFQEYFYLFLEKQRLNEMRTKVSEQRKSGLNKIVIVIGICCLFQVNCVEFLKKTSTELSEAEYKDVFNRDLSNAVMEPKAWAFDADGVLSPLSNAHGNIWTKERYGNFILELDFKVPEKGNSGVFIRGADLKNWIHTTIEIQIHATTDGAKHGQCGAVYDCLSPSKDATRKPGEWNHYVITCLDNKIYVNLNGEDIIDMDLDLWTAAGRNPEPPAGPGTKNKFRYAYKDMSREGHIGLQYHGNPIWFKNLRIKSFD